MDNNREVLLQLLVFDHSTGDVTVQGEVGQITIPAFGEIPYPIRAGGIGYLHNGGDISVREAIGRAVAEQFGREKPLPRIEQLPNSQGYRLYHSDGNFNDLSSLTFMTLVQMAANGDSLGFRLCYNTNMRKSYKHRIYPTQAQVAQLEVSLGLLRELYNAALQERRDAWRMNRINLSCFDQIKQISEIRTLRPEFVHVPSRCLAQTLRQLDKAFQSFFRRVKAGENPGFPRFKSKSFFNSIIYNRTGFRLHGSYLDLTFLRSLKINFSRPFEGKIKEVVVKREGDRWFAILSCDGAPANPLPATNQSVGVDVGIESFITLSDGTQIKNPRFYERTQKRLRVAQRRVSRRKKGSNRRRKAVAMLKNIHYKITNQRRDFQHKVSTWLIKEYDNIAVEKLNIKGLVKGRLSKQISDVGWGDFIFMLSYKAESAGRKLIQVNPAYTSQDCSRCKHREKKSLSVRQHHCSNCGLSLHRDHNAALNILSVGLTDLALT